MRTALICGASCLLVVVFWHEKCRCDPFSGRAEGVEGNQPPAGPPRDSDGDGQGGQGDAPAPAPMAGEQQPADADADDSPSPFPHELVDAKQDDEALIAYIRDHMLVAPSTEPRKLDRPKTLHYSQVGHSQRVDEILKKKTKGFFIECGAAQGEEFSNSLFFEKSRNWTGLLVEANPAYYSLLREKRRVNILSACLSPVPRATVLNFTVAEMYGGLSSTMEKSHLGRIIDKHRISGSVTVPCLPLFSILMALGVRHVDYFSLDVEGPELEILQTIPFNRITFDVLTVEYSVLGCASCTAKKLKQLNAFMLTKGYKLHSTLGSNLDAVYIPV